MKNALLIGFILVSSSLSHAGLSGQRAADCSNAGSTMEMIDCMGVEINASKLAVQSSIERRKAALKSSLVQQGLDNGYAEAGRNALKNLDGVMDNLDKTMNAICAAEGARETVTGSLGRLVAVSCLQEKWKALSKQF